MAISDSIRGLRKPEDDLDDDIPDVLNPVLYKKLQRVFANRGGVSVSLPGEIPTWNELNVVTAGGEKYHVNCLYCGDSGKHLWISPLFGTKAPPSRVSKTRRHWSWVKCYRNDCLSFEVDIGREHFNDLRKRLFPQYQGDDRILDMDNYLRFDPSSNGKADTGPAEFPGVCYRLSELPEYHPAIQYLKSRDFDPQEIEDLWDPRFCTEPGKEEFAAIHRLIIPVYKNQVMITWQGRVIDDSSKRPKYYNRKGSHKNQVLYGADEALDSGLPFVVLVEGVTDVWRMGVGAVAALGKDLSPTQVEQLIAGWGSDTGSTIFLFRDDDDPKAHKAATRSLTKLRARDPQVSVVIVASPGTDPGSMARSDAWSLIETAARDNGISI